MGDHRELVRELRAEAATLSGRPDYRHTVDLLDAAADALGGRSFDQLLQIEQDIRRATAVGMFEGTVLTIEFISGFELFQRYETWAQGWRVSGRGTTVVKEHLDDAVAAWIACQGLYCTVCKVWFAAETGVCPACATPGVSDLRAELARLRAGPSPEGAGSLLTQGERELLHEMKTPQPRWEECARGEHEWGAVAEGVRCRWCRVLLTGADADAIWQGAREGAAALRTLIADLVKALKWTDEKLSKFVTEDTGNGTFVRGTGTELAGFGLPRAEMRDVIAKAEALLAGSAPPKPDGDA